MKFITMYPLKILKNIEQGDQLDKIIIESLSKLNLFVGNSDILIVTHKIISKAEGRVVDLSTITPTNEAIKISKITKKDPALVEVILKESKEVLKVTSRGIIICRHKLGFVCANAGVDCSNAMKKNSVVLLPQNPDKSANKLRTSLENHFNQHIAIIINDTHGRSFRVGAIGIAIGSSGIKPLKSYIGRKDRNGYIMKSSIEAIVDEIASAATILMGQSDEGVPIVLMKGVQYEYYQNGINEIIRASKMEIFK